MKKLLLAVAMLMLSNMQMLVSKDVRTLTYMVSDSRQELVYQELVNLYKQDKFILDNIKTAISLGLPTAIKNFSLNDVDIISFLEVQKDKVQRKLAQAQIRFYESDYCDNMELGPVFGVLGMGLGAGIALDANDAFETYVMQFVHRYKSLSDLKLFIATSVVLSGLCAGVGLWRFITGVRDLYKRHTASNIVNNIEKEIKIIDAMITQLRDIENVA